MKISEWSAVILMGCFIFAASAQAAGSSGFGLVAGADWALGRIGSSSNAIQSRTVDIGEIHALPGWNLSDPFMVGVLGQYRWVGQLTDLSSVNNTNLAGHGYYLGVGGAVRLSQFLIQASFDCFGSETLSNQTSAGQTTTYSQPIGFTALIGYHAFASLPQVSVDAIFGIHSFKHENIGGTDIDISSDKLTETQYGLGLSYSL